MMNKKFKGSSRDGEKHSRWKIVEKEEDEEEHIGVQDVDGEDNLSQRPQRSVLSAAIWGIFYMNEQRLKLRRLG